jgi:two-component system sensor histidine kinase KdpD
VAAEACLDSASARDPSAATRLDFGWWCYPLWAGESALGALFLRFSEPLSTIPPAQASLARAMAQIVAQALARTRLAGQLERARVLGESERLRTTLLASVSHDLRSPLSTIIGSAESLKLYADRLSEEDQATLAGDILGEGLRLDRYIQNLLDMTRLDQAPSMPREWLGLDEICGAVLPRLQRSHPDVRVELDLGAPPPLLHVNPALIEQALFNLLDNAAKFSPPGTAIDVHAEIAGGEVRISVRDHGPGISPEHWSRVFERFYKVDRARPREAGGFGLGLAITKHLVQVLGGRIWTETAHDGGQVFTIALPRNS